MVDGIAMVLIDFAGQMRGMRQLTAFPLTLERVAAWLPELVEQLLQAAGADRRPLFGVGVSMTGPRIGDGTRVNPPLTLAADWMQVELGRFIADRCSCRSGWTTTPIAPPWPKLCTESAANCRIWSI